tara:strand:+ start:527 stop:1021 length:495 start_codon:yes stop_codon:yes gene_type:complete
MRNGLQKISFLIFLSFFFTSIDITLAEDVQLSPLINLNQIEPSYDSFDETLLENRPDNKSSDSIIFDNENKINFASLSILNKITANVEKLDIKLRENFEYGELRIYPIDCYLSSPEEKSETAIYLNVYHNTKDQKIFSGWMLKTLPSISAIEHPIYDIWVNDCH